MTDPHIIALCTVPEADAKQVARTLVGRRLAACVNILPGLTSVFPWEGEVQEDTEHLLVIKTRRDAFDRLQAAILEVHPYELPEIIAVPIVDGLTGYLNWIDDSVATS